MRRLCRRPNHISDEDESENHRRQNEQYESATRHHVVPIVLNSQWKETLNKARPGADHRQDSGAPLLDDICGEGVFTTLTKISSRSPVNTASPKQQLIPLHIPMVPNC